MGEHENIAVQTCGVIHPGSFLLSPSPLIGVIEFGATARNDSDQFSDKDIFAVVEDVDADQLDLLRREIASIYGTDEASVACYSASSFDQMITHGSLFTLHLHLEGKILYDPDGIFAEAFGKLATYSAFRRDTARFKELYDDVVDAYHDSSILDTFEHHVLFVVVRNICMILTARKGQPTFGRRTVIPTAKTLFPDLPISTAVVETLSIGHLIYSRNAPIESSTEVVDSETVVREVGALIQFAEDVIQ